jgi:hypothetical protein
VVGAGPLFKENNAVTRRVACVTAMSAIVAKPQSPVIPRTSARRVVIPAIVAPTGDDRGGEEFEEAARCRLCLPNM